MAIETEPTFWDMLQALPVRTGIYSVGPLVIALAQLLNGYYHGVLTYTAPFGVAMVGFAVLVTRYHLVEYRLAQLNRELAEYRRARGY